MAADRIVDAEDIDWTTKRNQKIVELAMTSLTYEQIGMMFGLSKQRVSQICVENGFERRPWR